MTAVDTGDSIRSGHGIALAALAHATKRRRYLESPSPNRSRVLHQMRRLAKPTEKAWEVARR